ncbi:release factor glutamine methyltransferase [Alphaproteobacteria bacterium]|nr:release factor glutamine methyltransferase [Alphaproteobacteria bacterium]
MIDIKQLLHSSVDKLKKNPHSNSYLEARLIIAEILAIDVNKIPIIDNLIVEDQKVELITQLVNLRVLGKPLAYLLKKREFWGQVFVVDESVLDPRPDSETLVELVYNIFSNNLGQKKMLLELGVGSGCLIISLLNIFKNFQGVGVDISRDALKIAKQNLDRFNLENRLELLCSNMFQELPSSLKFDIIISNPPYIPSQDIIKLQNEVAKFEPRIALDGGADGLDFYRIIAENSSLFLNKKGRIILEIGYGQDHQVKEIFEKNNFKFINSQKDLSGVIRVLDFEINSL